MSTNTYEIVTGAMDLLEEPESRRATLALGFLRSINYGYLKFCDDYKKPSVWEQITLDSERKVLLSTLTKKFKAVKKVSLYKDGSPAANYRVMPEYDLLIMDGYLIVPAAEASTAMWLRYFYRPAPLTMAANASDTTASAIPSEMPEAYQPCLRFYVAGEYGAKRKKFATQAAYWTDQFIAAVEDLKEPEDSVSSKIRNMYPAQPNFN